MKQNLTRLAMMATLAISSMWANFAYAAACST